MTDKTVVKPSPKSATVTPAASRFSIAGQVIFASVLMAGLVIAVGGWASVAKISGAVIAPGTFVVERNVKKVQHSYGGIVSEIAVKNGDRVEAGQILIKLDPTQIGAELEIVKSQILELKARSARLIAERDELAAVSFPEDVKSAGTPAQSVMSGEVRLFEEARRTRDSQKEQLRLRIEQLNEEIGGLTAQREAKSGELALIKRELAQIKQLHEKKLTPASRVFAMQREERRLGGEFGGLQAQIARAKGQISEINVEIMAVDENVRATAQRELRAMEAKLAELQEREVAARDKFKRIELRAPQGGIVHELAVHTIGGIVTPAEQVMVIVPDEDNLTIQARIAPTDIDQIAIGGEATLRLSAFNQKETPEVHGRIVHVAADVTNDPKTGETYYLGRIQMDDQARKTVENLKLLPGMPVEVFVSTGDRTALSYLAKPFTDQINRAFRE